MLADIAELLFVAFFYVPLLLLICHIALNWRNLAWKYRVGDLLVATGIIASALAVFGNWGVVLIAISFTGWIAILCANNRDACHFYMACGTLLTVFTIWLLVVIPPARDSAVRMSSAGHLKQIALAMHNYHDTYGMFPPAYLADEHGVPQHSWRVLLLPFLEEQSLYLKYNFGEPWDGPNYRQLLPLMPNSFRSPSAIGDLGGSEYRTPYVVIADPGGAIQESKSLRWSDFTPQEAESTILAVESANNYPMWLEPSDLKSSDAIRSYAENYPGTSGGHRIQGLFRDEPAGWYAAMVNGSVLWINWDTSQQTWHRLIKRSAGTAIPDSTLAQKGAARRTIYWNRFLGLVCFAIAYSLALRAGWITTRVRLSKSSQPN